MRIIMNDVILLLKEIGLNRMESQIYLALLEETKATGYKIAKIIGEPVSNTYKTLNALQRKGIVVIDESKNPKECFPVPISEYLELVENNFKKNKLIIENKLKKYSAKSPREGIFQIDNIEQVLEKTRLLINEANRIIMVDASSYSIEIFKELLEKRAAEGIKVLVKTYEPIKLNGCQVVVPSSEVRKIDWNDDWCNIITDDKEFLISFFEKGGKSVLQAIWSKSDYLAIILFSGFLHEFILGHISSTILSGKSSSEITSELKRLYNDFMYGLPIMDDVKNVILNSKK